MFTIATFRHKCPRPLKNIHYTTTRIQIHVDAFFLFFGIYFLYPRRRSIYLQHIQFRKQCFGGCRNPDMLTLLIWAELTFTYFATMWEMCHKTWHPNQMATGMNNPLYMTNLCITLDSSSSSLLCFALLPTFYKWCHSLNVEGTSLKHQGLPSP